MTQAPSSPRAVAAAVSTALAALGDLRHPPTALLDGRIEAALREALTFQPSSPRDPQSAVALSAAAARSACAHLAAQGWTDAYLALLTAQDHLGHRPASNVQ